MSKNGDKELLEICESLGISEGELTRLIDTITLDTKKTSAVLTDVLLAAAIKKGFDRKHFLFLNEFIGRHGRRAKQLRSKRMLEKISYIKNHTLKESQSS